MMDTCSCGLVKPIECTIPNELSCKLCIFGDYDVVSGRFIASNKCTSLAGMFMGEAVILWSRECLGNLCSFPSILLRI